MANNEVSINIHDHGKAENNKRARCNYCDKSVSNFSRLKCHLGGIRGDVIPCEKVPAEVKEAFKKDISDKKKEHMTNEVRDLPWKRNLNNGTELIQQGTSQLGESGTAKRVRAEHMSEINGPASVSQPNGSVSVSHPNGHRPISRPHWPISVLQANGPRNLATRHFQKCVGRFFFETGTDFLVAKAPTFRSMMNAAFPSGHIYEIPNPQELEGWILQDALKEIGAHVEEVRNSWPITGCSILLDGWTAGNGSQLVNILVDCPKGTVYLRSCDISTLMVGDVDLLQLFFEEILDEVGADNVVQIVTYCISYRMEMVGQQLMEKHKGVFWSYSASHCIEMMLERFSLMDSIRGVLEKAKTITKFVHSREQVLNLLEVHNCGRGLVKASRFRFAMSFMTLENIGSMKKKLKRMFASVDWTHSIYASQVEGKRVANLIKDRSFWSGVTMALKAATPLMRVLELMNDGGTDKHRLGYIYETIDQVKETIQEEFDNRESLYRPFWEEIDDIWNNNLHNPLHAAGCFLNPSLFYANNFYSDDKEVTSGVSTCITSLAESQHIQDLINDQVEMYRGAKGGFGQGCSPHNRSNVLPEKWWSTYAYEYPELQRFAICILSQTCDGASRYDLKSEVAEKLLTRERNPVAQQRLSDLTFVHYNLHLQNFKSRRRNGIILDEIDPMDDWVVEKRQAQAAESRTGQPSQPTSRGGEQGAGPSSFCSKEDPQTRQVRK